VANSSARPPRPQRRARGVIFAARTAFVFACGRVIRARMTKFFGLRSLGWHMFKSALIGTGILLLAAAAISAQTAVDCGGDYVRALDKFKNRQISPQLLPALKRRALRIYDACLTNDLPNARALFDSLDRWKD
jgi:hypothetical protein